jgi:hypothetical protein
MAKQTVPPLPLSKNWPRRVRSAAVHAIALARLALTIARGQANSADPGSGRIARLTEEILLIREEMRIKARPAPDLPLQCEVGLACMSSWP